MHKVLLTVLGIVLSSAGALVVLASSPDVASVDAKVASIVSEQQQQLDLMNEQLAGLDSL